MTFPQVHTDGEIWNGAAVSDLEQRAYNATVQRDGTGLPSTVELIARKDVANGYAGLDAGGLLKVAELPSSVETTAHKDAASGYAGLDASGLLKTSELPPSVVTTATALGGDLSGTLPNATIAFKPFVDVRAYGADMTGAADSSTALQNAINAVSGQGIVYIPPGTLLLNTGARIYGAKPAPGAAGLVIMGAGVGVTKIQLSSATYQFLACPYVADYDNWQNIIVQDLTVDGASITTAGHRVFGNYGSYSLPTRANFKNIVIRRVRTTNIGTSAAQIITNVSLASDQNGIEGTQNTITDCLFEDLDFTGGNQGINVGGGDTGITGQVNVYADNIRFNRVKHTASTIVSTSSRQDAGIQVGDSGFGGRIWATDCHSLNSADVGFEFDAVQWLECRGCVATNCRGQGFYLGNFRAPDNAATQRQQFTDCHVIQTSDSNASAGSGQLYSGWTINTISTSQMGAVSLRGCSVFSYNTNPMVYAVACYPGSAGTGKVSAIDIENFQFAATAMSNTVSTSYFPIFITPTSSCRVTLRDLKLAMSGSMNASFNIYWATIAADASGSVLTYDVDGLDIDPSGLTQVNAIICATLGGSSPGAGLGVLQGTMKGKVSRLTCKAAGAGSGSYGVVIPDPTVTATNNAISPNVIIEDADLSSFTATNKLYVKGANVATYADYSRFSIGSTGTTTKTW